MEGDNKKQMKKNGKVKLLIVKIILILFVIGAISGLVLLYGPWHGFRDWLITTSMTTLSHQWMCTSFYSDKTINEVLNNNAVIDNLLAALAPKYLVTISKHKKEIQLSINPQSKAKYVVEINSLLAKRFINTTLRKKKDITIPGMLRKRIFVSSK